MFLTMAQRLHDTPPFLGMGLYYFRPAFESHVGPGYWGPGNGGPGNGGWGDWTRVELKAPLILTAQQAGILIRKYRTDADDHGTAIAGAWALRGEVLQMGRDGIVAHSGIIPVGSRLNARLNQGGTTIVIFVGRPLQGKGGYDAWPESAEIYDRGHSDSLPKRGRGELVSEDDSVPRPFFPVHPATTRIARARCG